MAATDKTLIPNSLGSIGLTEVSSYGAGTLLLICDPTVTVDDPSGTDLAISPADLVKREFAGITGLVWSTVGVLSTGVAGVDYYAPGGLIAVGDIPPLPASKITSGQIALARGGTGADLSATGGPGRYLRQNAAGAPVDVSVITSPDIVAPGSTGQLIYNNANAFTGAAALAVGSAGQLACTPIVDPGTPAAGDLWVDSVQQVPSFLTAGRIARAGGVIWEGLSTATGVNATTPTSALAGIATQRGSLVIPANSLVPGKIIRPAFWFVTVVGAGSPTLRCLVKLGATTLFDFTSAALTATTSNIMSSIQPMTSYQVQVIGAAGKVSGFTWLYSASGTGVLTHVIGTGATVLWGSPVQVTLDTMVPNTFDVQFAWSISGCFIQFLGGRLSIEG